MIPMVRRNVAYNKLSNIIHMVNRNSMLNILNNLDKHNVIDELYMF